MRRNPVADEKAYKVGEFLKEEAEKRLKDNKKYQDAIKMMGVYGEYFSLGFDPLMRRTRSDFDTIMSYDGKYYYDSELKDENYYDTIGLLEGYIYGAQLRANDMANQGEKWIEKRQKLEMKARKTSSARKLEKIKAKIEEGNKNNETNLRAFEARKKTEELINRNRDINFFRRCASIVKEEEQKVIRDIVASNADKEEISDLVENGVQDYYPEGYNRFYSYGIHLVEDEMKAMEAEEKANEVKENLDKLKNDVKEKLSNQNKQDEDESENDM